MNKWMRVFFYGVMLLSTFFCVTKPLIGSELSPTIYVEDLVVTNQQSARIHVYIKDATDLASLELTLTYDEAFTLQAMEKSSLISQTLSDLSTEGHMITLSFASTEGLDGNFELFYFDLSWTDLQGKYPCHLFVGEALDNQLNPITITARTGTLTILKTAILKHGSLSSSLSKHDLYEGELTILSLTGVDLKGLSSGVMSMVYDQTIISLKTITLGSVFDESHSLVSINQDTPGVIMLSFAALEALPDGQILVNLTFESLIDNDITTPVMIEIKDAYDHTFNPIEFNALQQNIGCFKTTTQSYPKMGITSYTGLSSDTIVLDVYLDENTLLAAGDFQLNYDSQKLELIQIDIVDTPMLSEVILTGNNNQDGKLKFSYILEEGSNQKQTILRLTFVSKAVNQSLETQVTLSHTTDLVDTNFNSITLTYVPSTIQLSEVKTYRFIDYDTTLLALTTQIADESVVYPTEPTRLGTQFLGWEKVSETDGITTYQARYTLLANTYHIEINDKIYDGSKVTLMFTKTLEAITYTIDSPDYIQAGIHEYLVSIYLDGILQKTEKITVTIEKKTIDLVIANQTITYGSPLNFTYDIEGLISGDDLKLNLSLENTDVGVHDVLVSHQNNNYTLNYNQAQITITKAVYDLSHVSFSSVSVTYDGSPKGIEIKGTLPSGVTVTYTPQSATDAGEYTIKAQFSGDAKNYEIIPDMVATLTIEKATYNLSNITYTYTHNSITFSTIYNEFLWVSINDGDFTKTANISDLTPETNYKVQIYFEGDLNHVQSEIITYTIATYASLEALRNLMEGLDPNRLSNKVTLKQIISSFDRLSVEDQALVEADVNQLIEDYQTLMESLKAEYEVVESMNRSIFLYAAFILPTIPLTLLRRRRP